MDLFDDESLYTGMDAYLGPRLLTILPPPLKPRWRDGLWQGLRRFLRWWHQLWRTV